MSIDEKLLGQQSGSKEDKSAETAGALREARNNQGESSEEDTAGDFNASKRTAKNEQLDQSEKVMELLGDQEKSLSAFSSKWLVAAWRNLVPSWGLSFFYVHIHLFLQAIFGKKLFAPLGSEWFDRAGITVKQRDELGKKVHLSETMGVGACTVLIIFTIIATLAIISLLLEVFDNPLVVIEIGWSWLENKLTKFLGS